MHTTTQDLAILLQTFLNEGSYAGKRILGPAAVKAMTSDQNGTLNAPWGIGWALGRSTAWNEFGDLVSARTFGHAGASGTVAWADPTTQLLCVILTNRPLAVDNGRFLRLISNAVAAPSPFSSSKPTTRSEPSPKSATNRPSKPRSASSRTEMPVLPPSTCARMTSRISCVRIG